MALVLCNYGFAYPTSDPSKTNIGQNLLYLNSFKGLLSDRKCFILKII